MSLKKFALIVSEFNPSITDKLREGARNRLITCGVTENAIDHFSVPGAIEIPLIAKLLAQQQRYQAIICLGAIIQGDTDHYRYVCEQVSQGCQQIMLTFNLPVIFGILTTQNVQQALARIGGSEGHKGIEAADTALRMVALLQEIAEHND